MIFHFQSLLALEFWLSGEVKVLTRTPKADTKFLANLEQGKESLDMKAITSQVLLISQIENA